MATIKEIAELAGVSRGTVDRVLNHRGLVNPEKEKKVLEIAKLLNYQPNKAGVALAAQKKKYIIGILLFGEDNPFFDEVMEGFSEKVEELSLYGCTTIVRRISFDLNAQLHAIDELLEENMNGLILSPYLDEAVREKINTLWESGIPCVTVNTDIPDSKRIAYIGSDYYKCGQIAAGLVHLMTTGAIKIGIVTGSHNVLCHKERIHGFTTNLKILCPEASIIDIVENNDDDYQSFEAVQHLLEIHPDLDVLYFTAAGVYGGCRAINAAGLSKKLKVISFDAVASTCEMIENGTISATICQHPREQGAKSLSVLLDYLLTGVLPAQELYHMELDIKIKESF